MLISMSSVIFLLMLPLLLLPSSLATIAVDAATSAATATSTHFEDDALVLMDESGTEEPCPCSPETEKCCPFLVCCKITTPETTEGEAGDTAMAGGGDAPPAISPYE